MSVEPLEAARRDTPAIRLRGSLSRGTKLLLSDQSLLVPALLLMVIALLAIAGPMAWPKGPLTVDLGASLKPPSLSHPMGTDSLGRDIFARFCEGARISMVTATIVALVGAAIGGVAGLLAGALGSWADALLMRLMDTVLAFPPLILAMAVTVGLGVGLRTAAIGITITAIPWYARLVRSEAVRIRTLPFIESAAAIGASRLRVIGRHIVPHLISTVFIQAAAVFGYAILALAGLGFVGLGAQIPTPEWGTMITDGLGYSLTGQWWIAVFPGIGILAAVTGASLLADRARDILDPRGQYAQI